MASNDDIKWKVEGKRFNKRKVAQIPENFPFNKLGELMASGGGIFDVMRRQKEHMKKVLRGKGFDVELGAAGLTAQYFEQKQSDSKKLKQLKRDGLLIENDSIDEWAVKLWQHAEVVLSENASLESRIDSSYEVGRLKQLIDTYAEYGKSQRKAAQRPRLNEQVLAILKKLAKKGDSNKQLWTSFLGELDNEQMNPRASVNNMGNLQVSYTAIEGDDERPMAFKTFCKHIRDIKNAR